MKKVTLESLNDSIEQLSLQLQALVFRLEDKHSCSPSDVFNVFGSNSKTPNVPDSMLNNPVLLRSLEKAKTDSFIAKHGLKDSINPLELPGLELPTWVFVHFQPTASMGLDYAELAVAAYLFGNVLMYDDKEDIVWSYGITAHRDVFRSLLPDKPIHEEVFILVADMMTKQLTTNSGYWFLTPEFAEAHSRKVEAVCLSLYLTQTLMGKIDSLKRVFIPVYELNKGHQHWYLVVIDRLARQIILLDPSPTECQFRRRRNAMKLATYLEDTLEPCSFYDFETTPNFSTIGYDFVEPKDLCTLKDGSSDAGVWVASWMISYVEGTNFKIKVDERNRMKIAVSLVLKDHNIIEERIKTKAIENLQKQYDSHDRDLQDPYRL